MTRVAFFPDSFLEVNGVAHTGRQLVEYASRRQVPLLCVHAGAKTIAVSEGTIRRLELPRGPFSFGLDKDLIFDLSYLRHFSRAVQECRDFVPDVIHITGPNDNGILGALVAHRLQIPLVASWHTNLHEYSGRRTENLVKFLPQKWKTALSRAAERYSLEACLRYYRLGRVLYAPNPELCALLEKRCERPCLLMPRGVDPELFSPKRRARTEGPVRIGYVGRLSPEKNVRFLLELEKALLQEGLTNFEFYIIGQGSDGPWLRERMEHAQFPGVLRGIDLAQAYADMDIFAFPSSTDTFGNVVLEALCSGVPCVVTTSGGPKFIVRDGETGFVAGTERDFMASVALLIAERPLRERMGQAARHVALSYSWEAVFDRVYAGYHSALIQPRFAPTKSGFPRRSSSPGSTI